MKIFTCVHGFSPRLAGSTDVGARMRESIIKARLCSRETCLPHDGQETERKREKRSGQAIPLKPCLTFLLALTSPCFLIDPTF